MSIKNACSDIVAMHLPHNFPLCNLITTVLASIHDDLPFPTDKLIGEDWDFAVAGQKVKVTWTDPYREDEGYLLFLPGLASDDIYKGAIVYCKNCQSGTTPCSVGGTTGALALAIGPTATGWKCF